MVNLAILTHLYYEDSYDELKGYFLNFEKLNSTLLFSVSRHQKSKIISDRIKQDFPGSYIIETTNIGKDVGGKLALIDLSINLNITVDYFVLLHDKRSPHTSLGESWRKKLFRVVEPENIQNISKLFEKKKRIGIIAASEFITNEYNQKDDNFDCNSNRILKQLISEYGFNHIKYDFVGGTMFWVRSEIISSFFKKYNALKIRATLEKGNVLDNEYGTNTHAWERMLSWIAGSQGYYIQGI
ncbi:MAG: rhamnan synthesis F family protein [Ferruginibacter sp.]